MDSNISQANMIPCRFCGSSDVLRAPRIGYPVSTTCHNCGASGPQKLTGRGADAAWNDTTYIDRIYGSEIARLLEKIKRLEEEIRILNDQLV